MPYKGRHIGPSKGYFMLGSLRKRTSSAVVVILIGLLIISFAIWGIGDVFRFGGSNAVATVGKVQISPQAFAQEYGNELNRLQQQFGDAFSATQARELGLHKQVLQRMVNRELFDAQVRRLGVAASDEQVREFISKTPAFLNSTGQFDRSLYEGALRMNNMSPSQFEAAARSDLAREQFLNSLARESHFPATLANRLYAYHGERRVIDVARLRASTIVDLPAPDDAALTAYYEANSTQFMAPEYRALTTLVVSAKDFADDVTVTDADLQAYFDDHQGEYATPEKRALWQMVLPDRATAEAAVAALKEGVAFETVAQEKAGLAAGELSLGERTEADLAGELGAAIAKAAFTLAQGDVSAPLEGTFGWHVIKVMAITPAITPTLADVRGDVDAKVRHEKAVDMLYATTNRIEDELAAGSTLEDLAKTVGVDLVTIPAVDSQGRSPDGAPVSNLPAIADLLQTAFTTEVAAEPLLKEGGEETYYLLRVDGVTPPALRPLDSVREAVAAGWRRAEQDVRAKAKAEALMKALDEGQALEKAAPAEATAQTGLPVTRLPTPQTLALTQDIRNAAFSVPAGKAALAPAADGDGYVVVRVGEVAPGDPATDPALFEEFKRGMDAQYSNDLLMSYQVFLSQKIGVTFNETLLEETAAQVGR